MIDVQAIQKMLETVGIESRVEFRTAIGGRSIPLKFEGINVDRNFEIDLSGEMRDNVTKLTFIFTNDEDG